MKKYLLLIGLLPVLTQAATKDDLALLANHLTILQFAAPGTAAAEEGALSADQALAQKVLLLVADFDHLKANKLLVELEALLKAMKSLPKMDARTKEIKRVTENSWLVLQNEQLKRILLEPPYDEAASKKWYRLVEKYQIAQTPVEKAFSADAIQTFFESYQKALENNKQHYAVRRIRTLFKSPDFKKRLDEWRDIQKKINA